MINQRDQSSIKHLTWIRPIDEACIKAYLQGAVYSWCKNHRDGESSEHFSARTFLGGENFFWEGTPLFILYAHHLNEANDSESAKQKAGIDAGLLLKAVIESDKRTYNTTIENMVRAYWWDGGEINHIDETPSYINDCKSSYNEDLIY